jgi:hypothetical protein
LCTLPEQICAFTRHLGRVAIMAKLNRSVNHDSYEKESGLRSSALGTCSVRRYREYWGYDPKVLIVCLTGPSPSRLTIPRGLLPPGYRDCDIPCGNKVGQTNIQVNFLRVCILPLSDSLDLNTVWLKLWTLNPLSLGPAARCLAGVSHYGRDCSNGKKSEQTLLIC